VASGIKIQNRYIKTRAETNWSGIIPVFISETKIKERKINENIPEKSVREISCLMNNM